ncbi:MAG: hypothetical protein AAF438_08580 [Pseudomonadota bacterium]
MTSKKIELSDYYELLALHRALLESKFCPVPNDLDVSGSPIIATLHKKVVSLLIDVEASRRGEEAKLKWKKWLQIDSERREWKAGLERARSQHSWDSWSNAEKKRFSYNLLSPFEVDEKLLRKFISSV